MKTAETPQKHGVVESSENVRALGLAAAGLCLVPIIVLVPLVITPTVQIPDPITTFYLPKFVVWMIFSVPLLLAVVGAAFLDREHLRVPVLIPALAFLGVATLSTIFSGDFLFSLVGERYDGLLSIAAGVMLFYAAARFLDSRRRVRAFLVAAVLTAVPISVYGIVQNRDIDPMWNLGIPWGTGERAFSTLAQPVHFAAYLTLMMGATLALYFMDERRWARWAWLVALAVIGACWLYTYTRGSVLGVGLTLPVVLFVAYRKRIGGAKPLVLPVVVLTLAVVVAQIVSPRSTSLADQLGSAGALLPYAAAALVVVAAVAVALWLVYRRVGSVRPMLLPLAALAVVAVVGFFVSPFSAGFLDRVGGGADNSEQAATDLPQDNRDTSVALRVLIWRDTIPMILDRPLLGYGPDNFSAAFKQYQGEEVLAYVAPLRQKVDKAHNEFLQIAATTGLVGLAAYLWMLVSYFRNVYRRADSLPLAWPLLMLSAGILAYLAQNQTAFSVNFTNTVFWALLGASVSLMRVQDAERS